MTHEEPVRETDRNKSRLHNHACYEISDFVHSPFITVCYTHLHMQNMEMFSTIRQLDISDFDFPPLLKQLPDRPDKLFYLGTFDPLATCIAIVGTRHPSIRGIETAHKFAYELAAAGFTIVSGLAYGIDTAAHEGALAALCKSKGAGDSAFGVGRRPTCGCPSTGGVGKTIAVLGSGLDHIGPRANITLAEKIIETGGAIISEYEPHETGAKYQFIERNRIIAGMCVATIVIEAPKKSGALFTADFAVDYNRDVFAVPGSIYSENSEGTNELIKKGAAQLVTSTADVLEILGFRKQTALPL